ncbi:unnamed protein product [Owenia fusiformis]|uniref:Uncharacterized protein n=1 Tax=Owenia fusiformis TaxID=6347 RepID=A0A8J1TZK4_OWEFU|nr:unnamed protein product [Owenia fusiformis]
MSRIESKAPILSTAGAIPLKDEKGKVVMQKVKVSRYVTGKRPEYAPQDSSDEEEVEFGIGQKKSAPLPLPRIDAEKDDRRLKRLQNRQLDDDTEDRVSRHRRLHEPEVLDGSSDEDEPEEKKEDMEESSEEEEELDEDEIEQRRMMLRQRALQKQEEEELMDVEDEKSGDESDEAEESSEYEEYTDSEEEDTGLRLKPVFVRKKDRITVQEREKEALRQKELELETKKLAEERRRHTLKIVEEEARKAHEETRSVQDLCDALDSADEQDDEEEYEAWKIRELKRIKRDRDEREAIEKEKQELDRMHSMTEEERRAELRNNPKVVTNKAAKGKYKFLQKYYHRGAFFLDKEEDVFKRDASSATLEDHFDKTILPKVMQVKNFGRSGRTKYTHLVDQDTTSFESPWASDTVQNLKFHTGKGGGMKQNFERPAVKQQK